MRTGERHSRHERKKRHRGASHRHTHHLIPTCRQAYARGGPGARTPKHPPALPVARRTAAKRDREEDRRSGLELDNLELLESLRHVLARRRGFHVAVDVQNAAVHADVERVTGGIIALQDAVGASGLLARVAQNGVVQTERLGEYAIGLGIIDARSEVGDVERPNLPAARTERRAFSRSAIGERLREPSEDDRLLPFEFGEAMGLPVRAGKG